MAFITVEDQSGAIELIAFTHTLQQIESRLTEGKAVLATGKVSARENEGAKVILNQLPPLTETAVRKLVNGYPSNSMQSPRFSSIVPDIVNKQPKGLYIRVPSLKSYECTRASRIISMQKGDVPVIFSLTQENGKKVVSKKLRCWVDPSLVNRLEEAIGESNVYVKE